MKRLITLSIFLLLASSSYAQEQKPTFKTIEVESGLYMLIGEGGFTGGNVAISIGDDGVVMIDDAMPSSLDIMNQAIKGITERNIDYVINTHVHGDHLGNNAAMSKQGAHIVAHKNIREQLITKGLNGEKATKAMLPVITFEKAMSFHLNGVDAELIHTPKAHTDGDSIIHFKQLNVIHTGDNFFNGIFPYIDLASGGSVEGYIKAQKRIHDLADENTKIIPGHGPLSKKAELTSSIAMLEDATQLIKKTIADGMSEEQVLKANPLEKYKAWSWGFITTERMTKQLYQGLK